MEKRSPKLPAVSEKNHLSCIWGFITIFDFRQNRHRQKLMISNVCTVNKHGTGTGHSRSSNILANYDEKCQGIDVAEKSRKSTDGSNQESKHFSDALEDLNSSKELFLKFRQDQNSWLAKGIQNLWDSQPEKRKNKSFPEDRIPKCKIIGPRNCERPVDIMKTRKQNVRKFIWKKIKSRYGYTSKGRRVAPRRSNRIVALKPSPKSIRSSLQTHNSMGNKRQSVKHSYFSFRGITSKLKHAMGEKEREQQLISINGTINKPPYDEQALKDNGKEIDRDRGRERIATTFPTDAKGEDKIFKAQDMKSSVRPEVGAIRESMMSTASYSEQKGFDIFLEAKKHLSERLRITRGDTFSSNQAPRTLGRILLSPEHVFSPTLSPSKYKDYDSVSAQVRFSPYNNFQMVIDSDLRLQKERKTSGPSPQRQNDIVLPCDDCRKCELLVSEQKQNPMESVFPDTELHANTYSKGDDLNSPGYTKIQETNDNTPLLDLDHLELPSEPKSMDVTSTEEITATAKLQEENLYLECSASDFSSENETLISSLQIPSSSPLTIHNVHAMNRFKDGEEHPSPVSVLEPFFTDDVTSPASTMFQPAKSPLQPHHIDFEEHSDEVSPLHPIHLSTCLEDQESISTRVRAIVQASCLNLEELSQNGNSSEQLLNPSLLYEVLLFHEELSSEHVLLFDHINNILSEVHQCYIGCSPWVSFLKPKLLPVSLEDHVVNEVMEEVIGCFFPQTMPWTLAQLVGKDIVKSGAWVDIRFDTEFIATKISEYVLEESIFDIIIEFQS